MSAPKTMSATSLRKDVYGTVDGLVAGPVIITRHGEPVAELRILANARGMGKSRGARMAAEEAMGGDPQALRDTLEQMEEHNDQGAEL